MRAAVRVEGKAMASTVSSRSRRAASGKAARQKVSRKSHAAWTPPASRPDPVGLLQAADPARLAELVPIRYGRMLQSPFAFYRGSAAIMAGDLSVTPSMGVVVQSCGDCHLMNFGGFATPERNIAFDINDFDETAPAPWEWDVKRLAASFVLAARSNRFSEDDARDAALTAANSYRENLRTYSEMHPLDVWYTRIAIEDVIDLAKAEDRGRMLKRVEKVASQRGSDVMYPKLAEAVNGVHKIKESPPLIFHPDVTHEADFEQRVEEVLAAYRSSLPEDRRVLFDRFRLVDAALKVVGIGSVGTMCWIGLFMSDTEEPLFLQFKQAGESVLAPYVGKSEYEHNGQRVVMGQRLMQAASDVFLGWMTGPTGKHFYGRQLRDAKISARVETFTRASLEAYAIACGQTLARAHARAGDSVTIGGYLGAGDQFEEAIADFAVAYANQAERDYDALRDAVRDGRVEAATE